MSYFDKIVDLEPPVDPVVLMELGNMDRDKREALCKRAINEGKTIVAVEDPDALDKVSLKLKKNAS